MRLPQTNRLHYTWETNAPVLILELAGKVRVSDIEDRAVTLIPHLADNTLMVVVSLTDAILPSQANLSETVATIMRHPNMIGVVYVLPDDHDFRDKLREWHQQTHTLSKLHFDSLHESAVKEAKRKALSFEQINTIPITVGGRVQPFWPIKAFREWWQLPTEFGVGYFEPKDYTGLGSIDRAGASLKYVREGILAALPPPNDLQAWLMKLPTLEQRFRELLEEINPEVKLRDVEIEFAAAGFRDVCEAVVYSRLEARNRKQVAPAFDVVYRGWYAASVRVSQKVHHFMNCKVQVVTSAYGRIGLEVQIGEQTYFVHDASVACPAEGYMYNLLREVTTHIEV